LLPALLIALRLDVTEQNIDKWRRTFWRDVAPCKGEERLFDAFVSDTLLTVIKVINHTICKQIIIVHFPFGL
jgi:hypothetical protein